MKKSGIFNITLTFRKMAPALLLATIVLILGAQSFAQNVGVVEGTVKDQKDFLLEGATVILADPVNNELTATVDAEGRYKFTGVAPGLYELRARMKGFAPWNNLAEVKQGDPTPVVIDIVMQVEVLTQTVTVTSDSAALSLTADENAGALVLKGADLDALPEDPDDLADALQAMAGPSAGPDGAQFYIDGFTGGRMPPKASIREIRINQNPFSSEYDRLGFGRIEILTRPGTDQLTGQAYFNFNDEALNSRNPFAPTRVPYQMRSYGGNLGGPLKAGKASYYVDIERREADENAIVNAQTLDSNLQPTTTNFSLVTPQRRFEISPRIDLALSQNHTLVARYGYETSRNQGSGVGEYSLESQAFNVDSTEQDFSLTETAVFRPQLINETRFRFERNTDARNALSTDPALRVLDSFTSGGNSVGLSSNTDRSFEVVNSTSWVKGFQSIKFGFRLRNASIDDIARNNFNGSYTFAGGVGPELDENNQVVFGPDGTPILLELSSLERYRRTLLFQAQGLDPLQIRALGGGATQFTVAGGDPLASVSQTDLGVFVNDDWRVRPDLLLSAGIRYEVQNNISTRGDIAPRLSFAWSPGATSTQRPKTIVRGGFGLFYDRFSQRFTLDADRYNGIDQLQFLVTNPNFFPTIPSLDQLVEFQAPQSTRRVAFNARPAYSVQSAISVERQLPGAFTVNVNYVRTNRVHDTRSMNINAPLIGSLDRPLGEIGNVFEVQTDGRSEQNMVMIGLSNRFSQNFTIFSHYSYGKFNSRVESGSGDPLNPYNFGEEWGRASWDVRHRFMVGGSITVPWNVRLNPFVMASSGRPFNVTTGRDTNRDTLFTERPSFATDLTDPNVVITPWGAFNTSPKPGDTLIPRNYGTGPSFLMTRLRISKTIGFGKKEEAAPSGGMPGGMPPPGGFGGHGHGGGHGPGGHGGGFGGGSTGQRYNVTFSIDVSNLLNTVNLSAPVGNLTSPFFGQSTSSMSGFRGPGGGSSAGNRRIEFQLRFAF